MTFIEILGIIDILMILYLMGFVIWFMYTISTWR